MGSPQWEKVMDFLDDLAARFSPGSAGNFSIPDSSEMEFLRRQVATIEAYVEHFPSDERDFHALAWIEAHASEYRHEWQTQAADGRPVPAELPSRASPRSSTRV